MRFVFYTEKTIPQCMTAINDRMQVKATSTRPALDGWVEKGGAFALSLSSPVIGKFTRRTTLKAQAERESGITIIRGSVPGGAPREGQAIVFIALVLVALIIVSSGNILVGLLLLPVAAYLYIPLHGDYRNSDVLLDEVQKTLKAKLTPPKALQPAAPSAAPAKKPATAPKPAKTTTGESKTPKAKATKSTTTAPKTARATGTTKASKPATAKASPSAAAPTENTSPVGETLLIPDETLAASPAATPPAARPAPAKKTPPAEKKLPAPPADEFPEVPGEAPPSAP
ncbi:MAG: VirB3 family type IV secretion system protein [Anaerolineae bacterium]|nr:VirB3 family type IV secretion system protein [Anaerolineae bacterium]